LLIVVATIGLLAALLFPVLNKAKVKAQRTKCLSNLRQLGFGWVMYHQDNNGFLVQSYPQNNNDAWVLGDMRNPAQALNTDLIREGKLFPYNRDVALYHCPTDEGVTIANKKFASVRSYSMNSFMGGRGGAAPAVIPPTAAGYVPFFSKDSELRRPSQLWVLLDEDERSINDGFFVTDPTAHMWYDFPANSAHRHDFSFGLAMADGHADIWRFRDPHSRGVSINQTLQFENKDLQRLANASTLPK
jgi:hypothetical protein